MITLPSAKGRTYGIIKDPYYSAVSLLLHMNGANGSTTFTDSSLNNLTVTPNGSIAISTTQSKFGGASAYFDGTGDYLSFTGGMPSGAGTEFTIECWVRLDDLADYRMITRTVGGIDFYVVPDGSISVGRSGVVGIAASATGLITAGTWYHIALTRDTSNNYKIYINGVQVASGTNSFSVTAATTIGYSEYSGSHYFKGYIDDLRITKGVSRYNSNFTPPIRPYPDYEEAIPADPYYSSTSLLLHMDGTNGSTSFIDSGPNAFPVTFGGSAQISTTQSKFGGASLAINDTSSYISLGAQSQFAFGTGDFTIEMWIQFTNSLANKNFIDFRPSATAGAYPAMYVDPTFRYAVNSFNRITSTTTPTLGQWYHVAVSRQSGSTRMFINGVQEGGTYTDSTNYLVARGPIIGNGWDLSVYGMTGFIDDLRITKGVARYNSNFTPPTKAYPNVYNPYASLPVNGAILWLDASKQSSLFTDAGSTNVKNNGDLVYQWNDLSGANNHATQSTSGSRPAWSSPANGQNVLGGVSFNGSTSIIYPTISSSDKTVFIVHKGISSSSDTRLFTSYSDYSLSVGASVYSGGNLSFVREYIVWANSGFSRVYNPTIFNLTYTNSPSFSATLSKSENSGNTTIQTITSTGTTSGLSDFFSLDGTFYEFILFTRALSAAEMTAMNSYLRTKWGTA